MAATCALIPAAGRGTRFGAAENKVLTALLGRPLLCWTLDAFAQCAEISCVVLMGSAGELDTLGTLGHGVLGEKPLFVVEGGATRQESVACGLQAVPEHCDTVLVHDAARCCVTPELLTRAIDPVQTGQVVALTVGHWVTDTLVRESGETVDREGLFAVETPQVFSTELLRTAHREAAQSHFLGTDDASLVRALGCPVELFLAEQPNPKITRPDDRFLAEALLRARYGEVQ